MKQKSNVNELFTLRIRVDEEEGKHSATFSCEKDGEEGDFSLLEGENIGVAFRSVTRALSILGNLYARQLHKDGKMSDEEYYKLMGEDDE